MFNLKGRKYLVTGSGRGIGRAIAESLAEQGCTVYALSRSKEPLDSLVSKHPGVKPIVADVGSCEEIREKLKDIEVLDGVVNNALSPLTTPCSELERDRKYINEYLQVNVMGPINIIQIVCGKMVEAKKAGSVVNISSVLSFQAYPNQMPYCVAKAGLDMVTKQFALELGPNNIRVNSVNPSLVLTKSVQALKDAGRPVYDLFVSKTPMNRIATEKEVVNAVTYLLSDYSSMQTGTTNVIDGGLLSSFAAKM